jgi:hypothetical protein
MDSLNKKCPVCGSQISTGRLNEIQNKIRQEEKERLATVEANMRSQLEAEKLKFKKQAEDAANKKYEALQGQLNEVNKLFEESRRQNQEMIKQAKDEAKKESEAEIKRYKEVFGKEQELAVYKLETKHGKEIESYIKKVDELQRQLMKKAEESIEGGELDILEVLKESFEEDSFTFTADNKYILQEVHYKNEPCGQIIIDPKKRQNWQTTYVTKIRESQIATQAEHAVLAALSFPQGKKELCLEGKIIVVSPARLVCVVTVLREAMIKMYKMGLSIVERATKLDVLYEYIVSGAYLQLSSEAIRLTSEISKLDAEEVDQHQRVWKKRGLLTKGVQKTLAEINEQIEAVVEEISTREKQVARVSGNVSYLHDLKTSSRN